jgi:carbonic anhydrase
MNSLDDLIAGYRRFRRDQFSASQARFQRLARDGQAPGVMVIGCCDSRVDPAAIFDAGPGELFVVRNVANMVPLHEPDSGHHGTSAAIEFAVSGLKVGHVLVMGHAACGGIGALIDGIGGSGDGGSMIARWMSIALPVREKVMADHPDAAPGELQERMEKAAIIRSLENLRAFPFVAEALAAGLLHLHGAWFGIEHGRLELLDPESGAFSPVREN